MGPDLAIRSTILLNCLFGSQLRPVGASPESAWAWVKNSTVQGPFPTDRLRAATCLDAREFSHGYELHCASWLQGSCSCPLLFTTIDADVLV